jgi:hypothetical protein
MIGKHLNDVGKTRQRLHRRVPRHAVDPRKVALLCRISVVDKPTVGLDDLQRERGCRQNQREQRIRIERNRGQQIFEIRK